MSQSSAQYSIVKTVSKDYDQAIDAIKKSLADQGFGVLTEIDVSSTLKKKLNVDFPRTIILGACNPSFAHRALTAVPDIAVLLPCNVVVRENKQGQVEIAALNPMVMEQLINNQETQAVAKEVDQLIRAALNAVN